MNKCHLLFFWNVKKKRNFFNQKKEMIQKKRRQAERDKIKENKKEKKILKFPAVFGAY